MKRRVVEQGGVTLMLSLPRKWTKRHSLKKGDEIEILERDQDLMLSAAAKEPEAQKHALDLTNLHPLINFGLTALYVRGVDELEITSQQPQYIEKLQEKPINQFIGYEIIEQTQNRCLVKDLSGTQQPDYDALFRRIFLLLTSQGEEMIKAVKAKRSDMSHIVSIDLNVNRFCFLCLRMLNKYGYPEFRHTPTMYLLATLLEDIGDAYKHMAEYIIANRLVFSPHHIVIMEKIHKLFQDYQFLFFKFDEEKAAELDARYRRLQKEIENCFEETKSTTQMRALVFWQDISDLVARMLRNQLMVAL